MTVITESGVKKAIRRIEAREVGTALIREDAPRGSPRLAFRARRQGDRLQSEFFSLAPERDGKAGRLHKIGNYPQLAIKAAREIFTTKHVPAILVGKDPNAPEKVVETPKVGDMLKAYCATLKPVARGSAECALLGPIDGKTRERKGGALDIFGYDTAPADVTAAMIAEALQAKFDKGFPTAAEHSYAYLNAAFNWGLKSRVVWGEKRAKGKAEGRDWGLTVNPCAEIERQTYSQPGERFLEPGELRRFWEWLSKRDDKGSTQILKLLILTGQRPHQIIGLRRRNYLAGPKALEWRADEMKASPKGHLIPMPAKAVEIIEARLPEAPEGCLFPPVRKSSRAAHLDRDAPLRAVNLYLKETKAEPFIPYDLRRTFKTLGAKAGIDIAALDRIQAHAHGGNKVSAKHYNKYDYMDVMRDAMAKWEAYLDRIIAGELDDEVTNVAGQWSGKEAA